ncbi:hypothetical protein LA080_001830 [Diaporthe eres]|nr:hypothetical protein LA080_001830 [Diaporthe eres]
MSASPQRSGTGITSLLERFLPLAALIIPFFASVALISTSGLRMLGSTREDIRRHQTTISVTVQVLSAVMGTLQVTTLTGVISAGFRLRLATQPIQLRTVGLLNAIIVPRIPKSLSFPSLLPALLMVVLAQAPGAIWAGALTPVPTSAIAMLGSVAVPFYSDATADLWDSEFHLDGNNSVWNLVQNCTRVRGGGDLSSTISLSNCPVPNYRAQLLESAHEASAGGSTTSRNHSKPDNPAWTYRGRSYGIGAAQGLTPVQGVPADYSLLSFTYNETGYHTSVTCEFNTSASLNFTFSRNVDNVDIWEVEGNLPNSIAGEFYPVMAWHRDALDDAAVLAWVGVSNNETHIIEVVASKIYGSFSKVQCRVTFEPTMFTVKVNNTEQIITVSAVDVLEAKVDDVDQTGTGHLRSNAIRSINLLSRMSTSLYVSVLGEALEYNLQTIKSSPLTANDDLTTQTLRATADSFTAMLDDVLGIYGGSQLVLAGNMTGQRPASIRGELAAYRVGQPQYQWAIFGVNTALLLLILAEGIRTRWWRGLPCFDTLDFESIVSSAWTTGVVSAGAWLLKRGYGGGVMIKATGGDPAGGLGRKTGAVKGSYMELTDHGER